LPVKYPRAQITTNGSTNPGQNVALLCNVIKVWAPVLPLTHDCVVIADGCLAKAVSSSGFALLSGATSYRKVHTFIQAHYKTLDEAFGLNWKKLPAYITFGDMIQGTSPVGFS